MIGPKRVHNMKQILDLTSDKCC